MLLELLSGMPAFAAVVAPPDLRLCRPNLFFGSPIVSNASRTTSLALEYDKGFWLFYKRADVTFYYNKSF